jgi:hypothetical protein
VGVCAATMLAVAMSTVLGKCELHFFVLIFLLVFLFTFCGFVLFCCFVLFCFVLFCFVLFCFVLVSVWFGLVWFVGSMLFIYVYLIQFVLFIVTERK